MVAAGQAEISGVEMVLSVVWQQDNNNITKLLKEEGFELLKPIKDYWHKDSLEKGYVCPACGGPPCGCEGYVLGKGMGTE